MDPRSHPVKTAPAALPEKPGIFKQIMEYTAIVSPLLIIVGYIKLYFYYSYWGINIIDYLELSEIPLLFLNDAFTILSIILAGATIMVLGFLTSSSSVLAYKATAEAMEKERTPGKEENYADKLLKRKGIKVLMVIGAVVLFFIMFYSSLCDIFGGNGELMDVFTGSYFGFVILLFALSLGLKRVGDHLNWVKTLSLVVLCIISFLFFLYLKAESDRQIVLNPQHSEHTDIVLSKNDSTVIAAPQYYFIGKTKGFYFIHKNDSAGDKREALIIPVGEVRSSFIKYKPGNTWLRNWLERRGS